MACARAVGAGWRSCLPALSGYRARGSTAAERPRNGCGRCQRAGAFRCAAAATARATASPARAPLDQSDEEGAHRVVDLHEAPRHPSVHASRRSGLLRRRIFPCGQHRVPDHLRERGPPLLRTYHRLRCLKVGCLKGCLKVAPASLPLKGFRVERPKQNEKLEGVALPADSPTSRGEEGFSPRRTDKILCRFFGAPAKPRAALGFSLIT